MKFQIRADASIQIGSGHIMRCLTLAHTLAKQGHTIQFLTREHTGHLADFIRKQGFECMLLPTHSEPFRQPENIPHAAWLGCTQTQDLSDCAPHIAAYAPDWLICDHYALAADWQTAARQIHGSKIMVIDDLHDRTHDADLLLDQNYAHTAADYAALVPTSCRVLAGTRYALLRDEFATWRKTGLTRRNHIFRQPENPSQHILINLGGVDKDNHTLTILQQLAHTAVGWVENPTSETQRQPVPSPTGRGLGRGQAAHNFRQPETPFAATVIMGATAPHLSAAQHFAQTAPFPCRVLSGVNNMAELMSQADWAIGAAGSTSWERCCLGLPTLLLVIADNQRQIAAQLQNAGAALTLNASDIATPAFTQAIAFFRQPENLQTLSTRAATLCDGNGANRVAQHIANLSAHPAAALRCATDADCDTVHTWRNHPGIRQMMFTHTPIPLASHRTWYARQLASDSFNMYIYTLNGTPQGYGSLKRVAPDAYEWGFYLAPTCPRGNGSQMCRLLLQRAFADLGAAEVHGQVLARNAASLALHRKLGFRQPEITLCDNDVHDFVLRSEECWE